MGIESVYQYRGKVVRSGIMVMLERKVLPKDSDCMRIMCLKWIGESKMKNRSILKRVISVLCIFLSVEVGFFIYLISSGTAGYTRNLNSDTAGYTRNLRF